MVKSPVFAGAGLPAVSIIHSILIMLFNDKFHGLNVYLPHATNTVLDRVLLSDRCGS